METIRVDKNDIRDSGALALATCLAQNNSLVKVCFGGNPVSKAALKRVVQSLLVCFARSLPEAVALLDRSLFPQCPQSRNCG